VADLVAPRALLERATTLAISVLEGEVSCDEKTGVVSRAKEAGKVRTVAERALAATGCAAGARFCGDVPVEKSATPRVFAATARDAAGAAVAIGCTTAKVDQERLALRIRLLRYLEPAVCGDGRIQPTEQCEPGGSELCDDACRTKEILLSAAAAGNGTSAGTAGDKGAAFALWPEGADASGRFLVFFSDAAAPDKRPHVALATRAPDFTRDAAPGLSEGAIFLPTTATFPPTAPAGAQASPAAAFAGGTYVVAYESDDGDATTSDIRVRLLSTTLAPDLDTGALRVNGAAGAGETGAQAAPAAAAGPKGRVFVAWEDRGQGKIGGRVLTLPKTLGSQNDLSTGTGNASVSVAATSAGWVAVWQSATGIKLRVVNEDGTPQGAEQIVSEVAAAAEGPRVAALADGRFVVAFTAGGDVYAQRYDAKGAKMPGDQAAPVNDLVSEGTQSQVAVATSNAASGSFVLAWVDEASGHVRARMLGGTAGFLFNPVDGQASEFQASRDDGAAAGATKKRAKPSVAAGGAGPFVAIVWEDQSDASPGIFGRRFPLGVE
jgi:hypothetical protein